MCKKIKYISMIKQLSILLILMLPAVSVNGQEEYIAISKRGPVSALPGDLITYTITVGNGDQSDWTGTITDVLPDEFTFISSDPAATTVAGQTLTWSGFTVLSGENREITFTGYAGRLGTEFGVPRYPDGYYMVNSNVPNTITNNLQLENGTSGGPIVDSYTTDVFQTVDFFLLNATGVIKMSTGATTRYLVILQNLGNVWDRYDIYTDPLNAEFDACVNPPTMIPTGDNVDLENIVLDLDENPLSTTPWIAPGETYSFYLELTTPNGTPANRWNCTDVDVTSEVSGLIKTETFHTATIQPPSVPVLNVYNIDYPDPVACEDILNYTIYILNQGTDAYNTTVSNIYDPYFEFISSDPAPDGGTDNTWTLGIIPANNFTRVDIQGRILPGVVDQQAIEDSVIVSYDDGTLPSTPFMDTAVTYTTVNAYPDLDIEKLASGTLFRLADTVTYTINYSNVGCGTGTEVTIVDDFDELRTIIVDDGGGTVSGGILTFDIGTLSPADGIQTLEYSLVVTDVDCGAAQIENEVTISSAQPDADILNNSASTSVLAVSVPTWVSFPADMTVECDNVPDPAVIGELDDVWAEDACARNVTITFEGETVTPGDCDDSYTLTRTWRAEDDYGNFTERSQLITVIDTTAPLIACPSFSGYNTSTDGTGHVTVNLEANSGNNYLVSNDDFNTTATDNCDGAPLITYILIGSTTGSGQDLNGVTLNSGTTEVSWYATDQCGNEDACVYTLLVNADPAIVLTKSLDSINGDPGTESFVNVGDELQYGFTFTNTGNVTLYNVTVSDPLASVTGTTIPELAPAAVDNTSFTGSYVVNQADIDRGYFTNIASVAGTAINAAVASDTDTVTVAAIQSSAIVLSKSLDNINGDPGTDSIVNAGDELQYGFTITNTGNVTLYNVTVSDPLASVAGTTIPELAPAAVDNTTFTGSYVANQADVDRGYFTNIASVAGTAPDDAVASDTDTVTVAAIQSPAIVLTKSLDNINGDPGTDSFVNAGDELQYGFTITNTGNVTLYNVTVSDPLASVAGTTIPELAPAAVDNTSFTGSYVVTQADIDVGYFTNIASVAGTALNDAVASDTDTLTVAAIKAPAFEFTKTSTTDPNTFTEIGDELTYELLLSNIGNLTLNDISVVDSLTSDTWLVDVLSPGESELFTTSYFVVQADLDAGRVVNTASVIVPGLDTLGVTTDDVDQEIINANQLFTLEVTKTIDQVDYVYAGDIITYQIILENTGNVNFLNISVNDTLSGSTSFLQADNGGNYDETDHTVSWTIAQLSPGQILTYEIQVTVDDLVINETLISNKAVTESMQTYLVESNQVQVTALQMPEVQLVSVSHVGCYGDQTGMISVEVVGGLAPYTVSWTLDDPQPTFEVSNLPPGTYTVTVEDTLGNTDELSVTVEQPDSPLSSVLSAVDILCAGEPTGSIDLEINGGTAPYTYLWSSSSTTQDLEAILAGSNSVLVTDANACTWTDTITLEEPEEPLLISNAAVVSVVCQVDPTGSISFEIGGGIPPYEYSWSNNATSQTLANLTGGDYSLVATDANGCQLVNNFSVEFQFEGCNIEPPGGLTPYGEFDQTWIIRGLEQYENNSVKIFNRYGTMVYQAHPYQNDWTGEPNLNRSLAESDGKLASGTYYYILLLEPGSAPLSGYIYLMKE
jgi:uncharacterized repeat protein (TIGR01451 family)/gliding motility-associated-like protein